MPTKAKAAKKPAPEKLSWPDWVPPEAPEPVALISRDQLIGLANGRGLDIRLHDIENWQQLGAIPYGVRRMHEGAVRTIYPLWMVELIGHLRDLQAQGYRLDQIARRTRLAAPLLASLGRSSDRDEGQRIADLPATALRDSLRGLEDLDAASSSFNAGILLNEVADTVAARSGIPVARVEFVLERGPDGHPTGANLRFQDEAGEDIQPGGNPHDPVI